MVEVWGECQGGCADARYSPSLDVYLAPYYALVRARYLAINAQGLE
jgi:hypothetical protein